MSTRDDNEDKENKPPIEDGDIPHTAQRKPKHRLSSSSDEESPEKKKAAGDSPPLLPPTKASKMETEEASTSPDETDVCCAPSKRRSTAVADAPEKRVCRDSTTTEASKGGQVGEEHSSPDVAMRPPIAGIDLLQWRRFSEQGGTLSGPGDQPWEQGSAPTRKRPSTSSDTSKASKEGEEEGDKSSPDVSIREPAADLLQWKRWSQQGGTLSGPGGQLSEDQPSRKRASTSSDTSKEWKEEMEEGDSPDEPVRFRQTAAGLGGLVRWNRFSEEGGTLSGPGAKRYRESGPAIDEDSSSSHSSKRSLVLEGSARRKGSNPHRKTGHEGFFTLGKLRRQRVPPFKDVLRKWADEAMAAYEESESGAGEESPEIFDGGEGTPPGETTPQPSSGDWDMEAEPRTLPEPKKKDRGGARKSSPTVFHCKFNRRQCQLWRHPTGHSAECYSGRQKIIERTEEDDVFFVGGQPAAEFSEASSGGSSRPVTSRPRRVRFWVGVSRPPSDTSGESTQEEQQQERQSPESDGSGALEAVPSASTGATQSLSTLSTENEEPKDPKKE